MKITAFNGSPWGQRGHTYIIAQEFLNGARQSGAKILNIQLVEKKITPCNGCGDCFYKTPGKCVFKDDMSALIHRYLTSDVVVFATPLYMDNVTTLLKTFIDRLMPILKPYYEKDSSGQYRRSIRPDKSPEFIVISGCAMPEQGQFDVLRFFFKRLSRTMHTRIIAEIYRSQAGLLLLSQTDIRFRSSVEEYKKLLRTAGNELVKTGGIGTAITEKLEAPIMETEEYIKYANGLWDILLPKRTFLGLPVAALEQK